MTDGRDQVDRSVAIVGMAGRFPGAGGVDQFWKNLRDGRESIRRLGDDELIAAGVSAEDRQARDYVKAAAVLDDAECFDSAFFGYSPREADLLDPQHRLLLECAWEALEDAACDPNRCRARIGLIVGSASGSSFLAHLVRHPEILRSAGEYQLLLGNERDFLATRVSYKLNLRGPSFTVQSACSTSLVAVHLGCQSLLCGESDVVLAGGVCVSFPQAAGYRYDPNGVASPDGHCRPFDAAARGGVLGRGLGLVVLKRYREALADGDHIRAVILGSAVNNDGRAKVGFTAPSVQGQADVVAEAISLAGVPVDTIDCVEAHGTGTALGDPIEVAALTDAFRRGGGAVNCALGSVKANIGHLDAAAGVAGLIKTVLALEHREMPPTLHFRAPNPTIDFKNGPFSVNADLRPWPADSSPRRAGVSAFGIGGTNAHVIVEEAPAPQPSSGARPWQLLIVSARTEAARQRAVACLEQALDSRLGEALADAAYTLQVGRQEFRDRWAQVVSSTRERCGAPVYERATDTPLEPVLWCGAERWSGGGRGMTLYAREPIVREALDQCRGILAAIGVDEEDGERFAVQYAVGCLWRHWGVARAAGQGVGAWVAAALIGAAPLTEAIRAALVDGADRASGERPTDLACIEIGPGTVSRLCALPDDPASDEQAHALSVLGRLWALGTPVNWDHFYEGQRRLRVVLPTYPFERRRHWLDAAPVVRSASPRPIDEWFYVPSWKRSAPARHLGTLAPRVRRWLIFGDDVGLGRDVADALDRAGQASTLVSAGERFDRLSPRRYRMRPRVPEDYDALLADVQPEGAPEIILHLWNVTERADLPEPAYELTAFFSPMFLVQALARRCGGSDVAIVVAANHLHRVTGSEPLVPAKSLLRGICQVVPQEFPRVRCRSVDVQLALGGSSERARLVAQLIEEAASAAGPEAVAYRDTARFVETVEPTILRDDDRAAPLLRDRGVCIITGGLGGIGRTLAEYLAARYHARLALTYRHSRPADDRDVQELASRLATAGGEALIVQADAADVHAMARLRDAIDERFGRVDAIVHASGISPGGLLQGRTADKVRAVFRAKVDGLRVLDTLFPLAELDFVLLCSSLASLTHIVGQADYTAANAYLDAYAHRAARGNVVSVNWDTWLHAGMASRARLAAPFHAPAASEDGMTPAEGVEVFRRAIRAGVPQLAVSTRDLFAQIETSRRFGQSGLLTLAREIDSAAPPRRRLNAAPTSSDAPRAEIERRVARIWEDALGIERIGVGDDFFELGGNSLVGIQILARLRETFPVELPLSAIFETPTVGSMAASLAVALAKMLETGAESAG